MTRALLPLLMACALAACGGGDDGARDGAAADAPDGNAPATAGEAAPSSAGRATRDARAAVLAVLDEYDPKLAALQRRLYAAVDAGEGSVEVKAEGGIALVRDRIAAGEAMRWVLPVERCVVTALDSRSEQGTNALVQSLADAKLDGAMVADAQRMAPEVYAATIQPAGPTPDARQKIAAALATFARHANQPEGPDGAATSIALARARTAMYAAKASNGRCPLPSQLLSLLDDAP